MLQGARYLSADVLMDYHLAVLGVHWESLDDNYQVLLLGLLRGFGAGSFCVGLVCLAALCSWLGRSHEAVAERFT